MSAAQLQGVKRVVAVLTAVAPTIKQTATKVTVEVAAAVKAKQAQVDGVGLTTAAGYLQPAKVEADKAQEELARTATKFAQLEGKSSVLNASQSVDEAARALTDIELDFGQLVALPETALVSLERVRKALIDVIGDKAQVVALVTGAIKVVTQARDDVNTANQQSNVAGTEVAHSAK